MKNTDEIRRLLSGPRSDEVPAGSLVKLHAVCEGAATEVLQLVREIWATALWQGNPGRLSVEEWRLLLPRWFVSKFDPDMTTNDPLLRRAFQLHDRMRAGQAWTLGAWVRSLEPASRQWAWWSAEISGPGVLDVTVVVRSDADGVESLQWVLLCAGAQAVELAR